MPSSVERPNALRFYCTASPLTSAKRSPPNLRDFGVVIPVGARHVVTRAEAELEHLARAMPEATVLTSVPGIGVLTATALVAFVGDLNRFHSGRDLAAYLGLTPREHSAGQTRRLGRITKRGNSYLRMMLIHGARSALRAGSTTDVPDDLRTLALALALALALGPEIRLQSTSGHHPSLAHFSGGVQIRLLESELGAPITGSLGSGYGIRFCVCADVVA